MYLKKSLMVLVLICTYSFSQNKTYEIVNLDFNNYNSHFGLTFNNNNKVFFSAPILDHRNIKRKDQKKHLIMSLFEGIRSDNGQISNIKKFTDANLSKYSTSNAVVSPNGKYIYITTNYNGKDNTYKLKKKSYNLYIARGEYLKGKGWSNFIKLPFCDPNYSYGHPAISPDGKELYFVSNIPSAKGATDIFKVSIDGENDYSQPENLGALVNSPRKEMFPFIGKDGTLYFSSDRAYGKGGLDVYKSSLDINNNFKLAVALPSPINSNTDDFCFIVDDDKNEGYFSSRRSTGKGDDDIYYFTIINQENPSTLLVSNKP